MYAGSPYGTTLELKRVARKNGEAFSLTREEGREGRGKKEVDGGRDRAESPDLQNLREGVGFRYQQVESQARACPYRISRRLSAGAG